MRISISGHGGDDFYWKMSFYTKKIIIKDK